MYPRKVNDQFMPKSQAYRYLFPNPGNNTGRCCPYFEPNKEAPTSH